jgi:hypothetical protein
MRDVTHIAASGSEGTLRVDENSFVFLQESDLSEQITLRKGSTGLIKNVDLDVSSEGPFIFVEKNSVLELNDVKITHQSSSFSINSISQITSAESLFLAIENSSIHVSQSTLNTTNSAAFILNQSSSLHIEDSTVTSDSPIGIFVAGSSLTIEYSTITNTINEPIGIADGSSARISGSLISCSAGGQTISVNGSYVLIDENSTIQLTAPVADAHEAIYLGRGAVVRLKDSTVESKVASFPDDEFWHHGIYVTEASKLMIENSNVISFGDEAIKINKASTVFVDTDSTIDRTSTGTDIYVEARSSLFLDKYNVSVSCSTKGYVETVEDSPNVSDDCL